MWLLEKKFVDKKEIEEGVLKEKHLLPLTLLLLAIFMVIPIIYNNSPYPYWVYAILALLSSRLIAIDLRHFILPDIYTLPLLILGLAIPPLLGIASIYDALIGAGIGFAVPCAIAYGMYLWKGSTAGLGGGDIKLMAACGAWIGLTPMPIFIMLACIVSFVVSIFAFKNNHIPFGPGLCIALWIILIFQENIQSYILSI